MKKTHYFDDDGDGFTTLCGKQFNSVNNKISAFGLEDITCTACRRLFAEKKIEAPGMHPLTADLIMRGAIDATEEQREMAFKIAFGG